MGRSILAVIAGYLAMALFVFASFTGLYLALGADGAYEPGSYDISSTWALGSIVLGALGAVIGGYVCTWIARKSKPTLVLAGVALVLGLIAAVPVLRERKPDPGPRSGEVGNYDAMTRAVQPAWIALLNPVIGCIGILVGARVRGKA